MKIWIVKRLEDACSLLRHPRGCALAAWSLTLNDRWGLDEWNNVND